MDYSRFQTVYANLPAKARTEVVVLIDGQPFTWNAAFFEISGNTALGRRIFDKLIEMDII